MTVRLIDHTDEKTVAYCCRVSNPGNQDSSEFRRLLRSCTKRNEWSVLESSSLTLEFTTTRAISAQLIRHRSFTFQEFSQRWQPTRLAPIEAPEIRRAGPSKHHSLHDPDLDEHWGQHLRTLIRACEDAYDEMIEGGVHPECARMILPLCSPTRLYMTGSLRSWWHYLILRTGPETQYEHRLLANEAWHRLCEVFPVVGGLIGEELDARQDQ